MKKTKKSQRQPLTEARVRELIAEELKKREVISMETLTILKDAECKRRANDPLDDPKPFVPVPRAMPPYLPYAYASPQPSPLIVMYACQTFDPKYTGTWATVTYTTPMMETKK